MSKYGKLKKMLATEVAARKVYAEGLEAVNALEALEADRKSLEALLVDMRKQKTDLAVELEDMRDKLLETDAKAAKAISDANAEVAKTYTEAAEKVRLMIEQGNKEIEQAAEQLKMITKSIDEAKVELARTEGMKVAASEELEEIRAKLRSI